jgi:hypothetical protein
MVRTDIVDSDSFPPSGTRNPPSSTRRRKTEKYRPTKDQMTHDTPWNPNLLNTSRDLDVAIDGLLWSPLERLDTIIDTRPGAYGLFYTGPLPLYRPLRRPRSHHPVALAGGYPIYIGKAQRGLHRRMRDHIDNLTGVTDIDANDLRAVTLPVDHPAQAAYLEELLIRTFEPLWCQRRLAGFGSMPPGINRRDHQSPSRWSTLHPGRRGTPRRPPRISRAELIAFAEQHIRATADNRG